MAELETQIKAKDILNIIVFFLVIISIIIVALLVIRHFSNVNEKFKAALDKSSPLAESTELAEALTGLKNNENVVLKYTGNIIHYILRFAFGIKLEETTDSGMIILIAIWFIFFLILSDIIKLFGLMEPLTSKLVAIFLTLIIANTGLTRGIHGTLIAFVADLAGIGVILILLIIISVAVGSHMGLSSVGAWMLKRRAAIEAAKSEAGGETLAGTIKGLLTAGKAFKENA